MSEQVKALPIQNPTHASTISWRDYLELTKPRVVALMILTSVIGMLLAAPGVPGWSVLLFGNLGIALLAGAAAATQPRPWAHHDQRAVVRTTSMDRLAPASQLGCCHLWRPDGEKCCSTVSPSGRTIARYSPSLASLKFVCRVLSGS